MSVDIKENTMVANLVATSRELAEVHVCSERITSVLDYVLPSEQVILSARVKGVSIHAMIRFQSPLYTKKPVEYLNSSILAISLAQTGHVLLDISVETGECPYSHLLSLSRLAQLRANHEIYFINVEMNFHKRYPNNDYPLTLSVKGGKRIGNRCFLRVTFDICDCVDGKLLASFPIA